VSSSIDLNSLKNLFSSPKKIVITTHKNPDGDAMGSSLGLYNYLIQHGHTVDVITPNTYPQFLHWIPGNETVTVFNKQTDKAKRLIAEAEIIFSLDYNNLSRIEDAGKEVEKTTAVKIMIDHHVEPSKDYNYIFSDTAKSSTSEMVYDFIVLMGDKNLINKTIGECLYTGIVTDTGSFRFPSTHPSTHKIVAALIEAGVNHATVYNRIFNTYTEDRLRLLGYCLFEKLKFIKEYKAGYIALSKEELKRFNFQAGDTEGFVNYTLSVAGIRLAALFTEQEGIIRVSLRSEGDIDVNKIARAHFNGGGHVNAAGGRSDDSLEMTTKRFEEILPLYKDILTKN
jgi:phosphoesterase RecJ-like protein